MPSSLTSSRLDQLATGPLAFWFLNHDLEKPELYRQIGELKDKGFAGFFMHPRGGLNVPYGSAQWYEIILDCVREAERVGIEAWLYDEDPYPSGAAGGRVTLDNPGYRASELVPVIHPIATAGHVSVDLPAGALVAAYLVHHTGQCTRIDDHAGLVRTDWHSFHYTTSYYPPGLADGLPHWRATAAGVHYRLRVDAPASVSHVVCFVRRVLSHSPWGDYPDLLNPDAADAFFRHTHHAYAQRLGELCGTVVPGIFTDEAKVNGLIPWSDHLPEWYRATTGGDIYDILPHLVLAIDGQSAVNRWNFRRAVGHGLRQAFFEPMRECCQRCNLLLTGHTGPEEDPVAQVIHVPGLMGVMGMMDLPGTDLIGSTLGNPQAPLGYLSPKLASSAAHANGKRWVACEAFAVCDWTQNFADLTRATHWLFALGVNRLVTHGQYYSIDGYRKREAPPSQFFQASQWEQFRPFATMVDRLATLLSQGTHRAPVLLYYPEETFMALSDGLIEVPANSAQQRDRLGQCVGTLLTHGYDFDFADAELLQRVEATGQGTLRSGDESFQAIVVPGKYLTPGTWQKLQDLRRQGAPVLFTEAEITLLDGSATSIATSAPDVLHAALRDHAEPLWESTGLFIGHQRDTTAGPVLFLYNTDRADFHGAVKVAFAGPYEVAHPQQDTWVVHGDLLMLSVPAGQGVLIRQAKEAARQRHEPLAVEPVSLGEWTAVPADENCVVLGEYRCLASRVPFTDLPDLNDFSILPPVDLVSPSILTAAPLLPDHFYCLHTCFEWQGDASLLALRLVMESDLGVATSGIYMNGHRLPDLNRRMTYDIMNREADLLPYLRQGRNHILWMLDAHPTPKFPSEAMRLFGTFHAEFPTALAVPAVLTPRPAVYRCGYPVSAVQLGHAHYGGKMRYDTTFDLPEVETHPLRLTFGHLYESAEVFINGTSAGCLWCKPFEVLLHPGLLKKGKNDLSVVATTSASNYLQMARRPSGVVGAIRLERMLKP